RPSAPYNFCRHHSLIARLHGRRGSVTRKSRRVRAYTHHPGHGAGPEHGPAGHRPGALRAASAARADLSGPYRLGRLPAAVAGALLVVRIRAFDAAPLDVRDLSVPDPVHDRVRDAVGAAVSRPDRRIQGLRRLFPVAPALVLFVSGLDLRAG